MKSQPNPEASTGAAAPTSPDIAMILAAGQGTRMKSAWPKVLHEMCGRPMLFYALDQILALEPKRVLVVVGHEADKVRQAIADAGYDERVRCVVQEEQLGTGHAAQVCLPEMGEDPGCVLLTYGDMPLLSVESLRALLAAREEASDAHGRPGAAMLTAVPSDPRAYGRVLRKSEGGDVAGIVEEKDCTPEELAIREVNLGVYALPGPELVEILPRLTPDNAQGEYYVTDVVRHLFEAGHRVVGIPVDEREGIGVNNLAHLAEARCELQRRILEEHLLAGVAIEDPDSTYIDWGVEIGAGTRILPCTVIRSGVVIGADCEVGPFTHLRGGTRLRDRSEVGNFTEVKKSELGEGTKAKHLSYLGDTTIGPGSNIGAGTIFANYDGVKKHRTTVGARAFIGSGTILVAPNEVGEGATTGAGAVVTRQAGIPPGETWIGVPARPLRPKARAGTGPPPETARPVPNESDD